MIVFNLMVIVFFSMVLGVEIESLSLSSPIGDFTLYFGLLFGIILNGIAIIISKNK